MAYRLEKTETGTDIVIDGWEQGIAPSPHKGIANLQNANISTELGEVTASFVRTAQTPAVNTITGGTLTASVSDGTTLLDGPSNLQYGQFINVTAATVTITDTTAPIDYLVVGGGGGGGSGSTVHAGAGGGGAGGYQYAAGTNMAVGAYPIVIGAGGAGATAGGSSPGTNGSDTTFNGVVSLGGGGGGYQNGDGSNGASGGGGGGAISHVGGTGTVGQGKNGGTSTGGGGDPGGGGAGGGGATAAGSADSGANAGNGGVGTANSITGSSVTYADGGGGGIYNGTGGGTGGSGNGGTGGNSANSFVGQAGVANTGSGGGGAGSSGVGNHAGGAGGSGIVVVRYLTTDLTATGGTITTDGSYTVHTFTSSGTFTITAITKQITLPNGTYFIDYKSGTKFKISYFYDPLGTTPIVHSTSGTITFDTIDTTFGNPLAKATEKYQDSTSTQYRYYILDANGYVWVFDTKAYATYGLGWHITDTTDYSSYAFTGMAILNGWLHVLNNVHIYGKPTVDLGRVFTSVQGGNLMNPFPTHTNYAMTGHQGRMYYCDGNYIGALFPDTSILSGTANIQSYCSYTAVTDTGTITSVIDGSLPNNNATSGIRIPAIFFTDSNGTQPTNLTAGTVYYIANGAGSTTFDVFAALTGGSAIDIAAGASGNQYFNTYYPTSSDAGPNQSHATCTFAPLRVNLPFFETAKFLCEIGNTVLIGCAGSVVYPWNQVDVTPSSIINLPEGNVQNMLTVNQIAYIFAGNQGNVYVTDGSLASLVLNLPDYIAGVPGSPGTYIESTYTWGDTMYLRGRVYFGVLDQSASKTGNCGGIWSFVPAQNLYEGQATGIALRLEAQNTYATYNGATTILIPNQVQDAQQPLYWSAWYSSVSAPTYGIDYSTGGTSASFPTVIETDAIPIGTFLLKKTITNLEYKLGAPLDTNATITAKYRTDVTSAWASCNPFIVETNRLSGYAPANFQQVQWVQFQFTLTPITSSASTNTFIRFREIRLR